MSKFCGGIKLAESGFKIIDDIITMDYETTVNADNTISVCGQLWDSKYFAKININGHPCITLATDEGYEWDDSPKFIRGNCGIGLDGRAFKLRDNNEVGLVDYYGLTLITIPEDATVTVTDSTGAATMGDMGRYTLSRIGDKYTITVEAEGYVTQTKIIKNVGYQTITITLVEE